MLRSVSSSVSKRLLMSFNHLDYCNSLMLASHRHGFYLSSQSCSQTHFPSLIATLIIDVLHWLPATYHVHYTVLLLVSHAQKGQAPKCLFDLMRKPLSVL